METFYDVVLMIAHGRVFVYTILCTVLVYLCIRDLYKSRIPFFPRYHVWYLDGL